MSLLHRSLLLLTPALLVGCLEPPPKLAVLPPTGLALRVDVFGADAQDGRSLFDAVKSVNKSLALVQSGGDGEVLLGLDRDPVPCVEPTGYCEYRVALRVRDAAGTPVLSAVTRVGVSAESCYLLCRKALQKAVTQSVERAATVLKRRLADQDGDRVLETPRRRAARRKPVLCGVGLGPRLPSEEAERRIAQIDALKRQGVLSPEEFECLRKAFVGRL